MKVAKFSGEKFASQSKKRNEIYKKSIKRIQNSRTIVKRLNKNLKKRRKIQNRQINEVKLF